MPLLSPWKQEARDILYGDILSTPGGVKAPLLSVREFKAKKTINKHSSATLCTRPLFYAKYSQISVSLSKNDVHPACFGHIEGQIFMKLPFIGVKFSFSPVDISCVYLIITLSKKNSEGWGGECPIPNIRAKGKEVLEVMLATWQSNQSREELLGQGITTSFWKVSRLRRWQASISKNHLPSVRTQTPFIPERGGGVVSCCRLFGAEIFCSCSCPCRSGQDAPANLPQNRYYSLFCSFLSKNVILLKVIALRIGYPIYISVYKQHPFGKGAEPGWPSTSDRGQRLKWSKRNRSNMESDLLFSIRVSFPRALKVTLKAQAFTLSDMGSCQRLLRRGKIWVYF